MGADQGIPGWFIAIVVVILVMAIGSAIWRFTLARRIAEQSGLDPNTAAAVTMLGKGGVDAAYLASTLSRPQPVAPPSAEQRLRELQTLLDRGLITVDEYATRRRQILDSI